MTLRTSSGPALLGVVSLLACSSTPPNEFPPTHYASIIGTVRDSLSAPAAGLLVTLGPDDHFSLARTTTAADGHYSLLASAIYGQLESVPDSVALPLTVYRDGTDSVLYVSSITLPIARAGQTLVPVERDIALGR